MTVGELAEYLKKFDPSDTMVIREMHPSIIGAYVYCPLQFVLGPVLKAEGLDVKMVPCELHWITLPVLLPETPEPVVIATP